MKEFNYEKEQQEQNELKEQLKILKAEEEKISNLWLAEALNNDTTKENKYDEQLTKIMKKVIATERKIKNISNRILREQKKILKAKGLI